MVVLLYGRSNGMRTMVSRLKPFRQLVRQDEDCLAILGGNIKVQHRGLSKRMVFANASCDTNTSFPSLLVSAIFLAPPYLFPELFLHLTVLLPFFRAHLIIIIPRFKT